jgi:Fe-S-cluster containining protein
MIDKQAMKNYTLKVLDNLRDTQPDCSYCLAPCCYLIVTLTDEEIDSGRYQTREVVMKDGPVTALAAQPSGRCVYGQPGGKCSIYKDRPKVCVDYTCHRDPRIMMGMKYLGYTE